MKTFEIYLHPEKEEKAVKKGFSWPAFFVAPIWAFVNGLIGFGIMVIIFNFIVIRTVSIIYGFPGFLLGIATGIFVGSIGNQSIKNRLLRKGYIFSKTVSAKNYKEALGSSSPSGESNEKVIAESQEKLMPVEEYAKQNNLEESNVVQKIKDGNLIGKVEKGKWFVDVGLSNSKENVLDSKDISKEKVDFSRQRRPYLRWIFILVGIVLAIFVFFVIRQTYAQRALQKRIRNAAGYLKTESQEPTKYEPYYLSNNNARDKKASQEVIDIIQKAGIFSSSLIKKTVQGKLKTSKKHPLKIRISAKVDSLSEVSEEINGTLITGKVWAQSSDTSFTTAMGESEGVKSTPGSSFVEVSFDNLVMYLTEGFYTLYGELFINGNVFKFLQGEISDSTNGTRVSFAEGTACQYDGKKYVFSKKTWFVDSNRVEDVLETTTDEKETKATRRVLCEKDCQQMYDNGSFRSGVTVDECIQKSCR